MKYYAFLLLASLGASFITFETYDYVFALFETRWIAYIAVTLWSVSLGWLVGVFFGKNFGRWK